MLNQTVFGDDVLLGGHSTCLRRLASIGARHAEGPRWMPAEEGGAGRIVLAQPRNCRSPLPDCHQSITALN